MNMICASSRSDGQGGEESGTMAGPAIVKSNLSHGSWTLGLGFEVRLGRADTSYGHLATWIIERIGERVI